MSAPEAQKARPSGHPALHPMLDPEVTPRLCIRPARHDGEQAAGHWLRLAHTNGLADPRWLLSPHAPRASGVVRVCPVCLVRPHPWWPQTWSDREHPWCAEHGSWLVDTCPTCHQPLRWHGVRLLRCRCGQALSEIPAPALTPDQIQALIAHGAAPLSVVVWLGALAKHGLRDKPLKKAARQGMTDVIELAEHGTHIVKHWPGGFFRALDACRVHSPDEASLQLLNLTLPGLTRRIRKLGDAGWRQRIKTALSAYTAASRQSNTPIIGRNVQVPDAASDTLLSVARALKIRTESLTLALESLSGGGLKKRRTVNGRSRRLVSPEVIQKVRTDLEDRISTKAAANLLGLSHARVEQMVQAGQLVRQGGRLSKQACSTLLRSVMQMTVGESIPQDIISFSDALRFWVPVARSSAFFGAVLCGELPVFAEAGSDSLRSLLLDRERVMAWAATRPNQRCEWLSLPDCAVKLGIKQEVAYHLVRVGLLPTQKVVVHRRTAQVVSLQSLKQFERRYEPLVKAAGRAGIDHRNCLTWARANGLQLVSGPQVDGGRQYFVRVRTV